ncbi:GPI biosynthesis protein family Pig-F-domain-containing protein [Apodospora peruviana]|uniref:GPI biosynthesis protein family Pig-F-domain-containing protein n=1 Tax=Apodospora peruviana TaxID=516989 RepID=A0AAE0MAN8_9PEZI|nr:GPI biosynthesis protein family Pig-F-domain-containing protein [Apodospora peruviana]
MPLVDPVTMSSSIAKGAAAQAVQSSPITKGNESQQQQQHPIQLRQTPLAQSARHALPALIAAVFLIRFDSLVNKPDPAPTMKTSLPVVAALQLAYAMICLPVAGSAGSQNAKASSSRKPRLGEKKSKSGGGGGGDGPNGYVAAVLSLVLTTFVTPFLYIVMILFGAPFLTHGAHTFLCAAHLAVLVFFPLFYAHGVDSAAWAAVGSFRAPFDETFGGLVGGVVGGWLGAVPIPLDWDREWQKWPVTVLCGIYGGYFLGRILGGTVLFGKRF